MGDWVVDGWRGNKAGRQAGQASSSPGSAGVKRWQWQCCKLMVALRHQMDKQAGALRKLLLLANSCSCSCCPPPKHQLDERTDKFKAVATALRWRGLRGDWDKGRLGMGGIWGAGIGSSNNNCRDYALTQALCSLPMRVDGYVHVCVHLPAPLSVASFRLFLYVFTNGIVFNEISDANLFI